MRAFRWVEEARHKSWQRAREREHEEREAAMRENRKQAKSLMRAKKTKYTALNAWEIAHFKRQFTKADVDGDGYLTLAEVHELVENLKEDPKNLGTWQLLDTNCEKPQQELITVHEFLVFLSIKRSEDDTTKPEDLGRDKRGAVADEMRSVLKLRRRRPASRAMRARVHRP